MRYWRFTDSVQSCSNDNHVPQDAVETSKKDFELFIASLNPEPIKLPAKVDMIVELNALKIRIENLEISNVLAE
jgi:hypothetical protein